MEKLFISSIIKGLAFCVHHEIGPQPLYIYPIMISDEDFNKIKKPKENLLLLSYRDYMQIAIKNLSLLLSDELKPNKKNIKNFRHFAIIPYPDFNLTSLTFFHFMYISTSEKLIETSFSILVNENNKN